MFSPSLDKGGELHIAQLAGLFFSGENSRRVCDGEGREEEGREGKGRGGVGWGGVPLR